MIQKKFINRHSNEKCSLILTPTKEQMKFVENSRKLFLEIFSRKSKNCSYPFLTFNNRAISGCPQQKHLGVVLDSKLNSRIYLEEKIIKCKKIVGLMRRLSVCLPRKVLLITLYKPFFRPQIDYGDNFYDIIKLIMKILYKKKKKYNKKLVQQ